jgi:GMP synthase PP-ATPase subunit
MLNRWLTILLLAALISSNFSRVFVYAGFEANQNYIAKVLCVNKERPLMHCDGHCYLMKNLKEVTEKEKKQEEKENLNRVVFSFFQEPFQMIFTEPRIFQLQQLTFPAYKYHYGNSFIETIFRPPKSV